MPTTETRLADAKKTVVIVTAGVCEIDKHPDLLAMITQMQNMHAIVPLDRVLFEQTATPREFRYVITAKDGRKFKQTIVLPEDATSPDACFYTFDVQPAWRLREFAIQREFRQTCVKYALTNALLSCDCRWT